MNENRKYNIVVKPKIGGTYLQLKLGKNVLKELLISSTDNAAQWEYLRSLKDELESKEWSPQTKAQVFKQRMANAKCLTQERF